MGALSGSVGYNGMNLKQDVMRVQRLLRTAGLDPGRDDGICGNETITAIRDFQRRCRTEADGLIETEGPTWRKLAEVQQEAVSEETKA